jgi:serine/threonine protein kinase
MSKNPTVLLCPHCRSRVLVNEGQAGQSLACSCSPPGDLENTYCSEGKTTFDILFQHVFGLIPNLRTLRPDMPARAIAIVERLLEKNPQDRYQTAADLVRDLELFLQEEQADEAWPQSDSGMVRFDDKKKSPQPLPRRGRRARARWLMAAGIVGLAVGIIVFALENHPSKGNQVPPLDAQLQAGKNDAIAEVPNAEEPAATDEEP